MKYLVTLKRKQTLNAEQNARTKRVEVIAKSEADAEHQALMESHNHRYFTVESVRRA